MSTKRMRRVERSARAVIHGAGILELLRKPVMRRRLATAAASTMPPITAISSDLLKLIGARDAKLVPVKQFAGLCVRAVLEEEGFEIADTGVRIGDDPMFRTGSTYRRAQAGISGSLSLLTRLISSLTEDEAKEALELLRRRQ